jgi:hypothetical protein
MTPKELDALVERLRATRQVSFTVSARDDDDPVPALPINPDGPAAADAIATLQERVRVLEETVRLVDAECDRAGGYIKAEGLANNIQVLTKTALNTSEKR